MGYSPWGLKKVRHNLATKQQLLSQALLKHKESIYTYFVLRVLYAIPKVILREENIKKIIREITYSIVSTL